MEFPEQLISRNKEIISDIITKFNQIENSIKEIISEFIASEKTDFITNVLLNNLIISFSSKFKVLQYIIANQEIEIDKNFNNSIKTLMSLRNIIAHSDNLLDYNVIPLKENLFFTQVLKIPKATMPYQRIESKNQFTLNNGQMQNFEIEKIHSDFTKHFKNASKNLKYVFEVIKEKN